MKIESLLEVKKKSKKKFKPFEAQINLKIKIEKSSDLMIIEEFVYGNTDMPDNIYNLIVRFFLYI